MSSSQSKRPVFNYGSPCAACKFLRRKCLADCIFAPHFPPEETQKFEIVHRIYGASNVSKILNQLSYDVRDEAVNSLVYEAEARVNEPVHGCVGFITILHERLKELQAELSEVKTQLSIYGPMAPPSPTGQGADPRLEMPHVEIETQSFGSQQPHTAEPEQLSHNEDLYVRPP